MNNYLELKKQQVKSWSKIVSLILASLSLVYALRTNDFDKDVKKAFWSLLILLALITYLTSYYTLTSFFWPEPLSLTNHLLLIPSAIWTAGAIWDRGKLLLTIKKT